MKTGKAIYTSMSLPAIFLTLACALQGMQTSAACDASVSQEMEQALINEESEEIKLTCLTYGLNGAGTKFKNSIERIGAILENDGLMLKMVYLGEVNGEPYVPSTAWIKGKIEGNKFIIRDGGNVIYDHPYEHLYSYGANFGDAEYEFGSYSCTSVVPVFRTDKDITVEYTPETHLLRSPDSGILVSNGPLYSISQFSHYHHDEYSQYCLYYEAIADFLIGEVTAAPPISLPAPEVLVCSLEKKGNYTPYYRYMTDVRLDVVTEDKYILNLDRITISFYQGGTLIGTRPFRHEGNPFSTITPYLCDIFSSYKEIPSDIEVQCCYECKDGRIIESPKVSPIVLSGVEEIKECQDNGDNTNGPIYDLTGRMVRGESLSPGIYIRNGRKFVVGR